MKRNVTTLAALAIVASTFACGFAPESVSFEDPRVVKLLDAAKAVDRDSLGFTPIDRTAKLQLEWRPRAGYDAMLHVYGKTSRTIAFRRTGDSYEWIHEQEIFEGPMEYETPDGRFHEAITLTWEAVSIATQGMPLRQLRVGYRGDDPKLSDLDASGKLSLDIVRPVLKAWAYRQ